MNEQKEEKVLSKEQLKLRAQEMKLEEKQRKMKEKAAIREEKERRKNSLPRKIRNFFLGIIFIAILLVVGFYFGQRFLTQKEKELSNEKMEQTYKTAVAAMNDKDYKKAIELLKSIDKKYSKYSEVAIKLDEADKLYLNTYLIEADNYTKNEKYEKALATLDEIENEYKDEKIVEEKRISIKIKQLQSEIEEMAQSKTTLKMLEYIIKYDTEDTEEIEEAIEKLTTEYKNKFIKETTDLIETDKAKAQNDIKAAIRLLPKDKDIKALQQELEKE